MPCELEAIRKKRKNKAKMGFFKSKSVELGI